VPIPSLLDRVARNFLPERRLRGVDLFVRSDIPDGTIIAGDEQLLAGALSGALIATLALTDGVSHAAITISGGLVSSRITIEISQNTVAAPAAWSSRAFDEHWTSRPGGIPALVAMLALRRSVEQHRGVVSATAVPDGTRISISLPTGT
jgi:hypothetical protein